MGLDMRKLGKKRALVDHRVPRLSIAAPGLPTAPTQADWHTLITNWPMLANDQYGCCVEAAVLHCIQQFSGYATNLKIPTEAEAVSFYELATGFNPFDPTTDQGSYVLGPGGVMEYWLKTGVMCAGNMNNVQAFLQITHKSPDEWTKGIYYFGGMLTGLQLPEAIMAGTEPPDIWQDFSGDVAGGHEVWVNGYESLPSGRVYDLVSWGRMYQATEEFLLHCVDEACVVIDPIEISARGVNAAGIDMSQLITNLGLFQSEA